MNLLKEKGIPIDKQILSWHDIVRRPYNRFETDCYTRCRQILMNGIETEAWSFKHCFLRNSDDIELNKIIANIRRIEDTQQTTMNWMTPYNQTVLDTTLGYEQVAVDLTAWLAQNEDDSYVKETFNFGLLEDFDHLYRYSQFANYIEETDPNEILHNQTDVMLARPTQFHHNDNSLRIRNHYNKNTVSPRTRVNILTLISAEQQTHNFYAEHGFMFGNVDVKKLYAEICDIEEEHVTMYETLVDPNESFFEKWLIHEFTEACCYYNCYNDEDDKRLKLIYEQMLNMEIEHLKISAEMYKKYENKDPEEIIGIEVIMPCTFKSQKDYVNKIINSESDKRVDENGKFNKVKSLSKDWKSYTVQERFSKNGAPSEEVIHIFSNRVGRDLAISKKEMLEHQPEILEKAMQEKGISKNTVCVEKYKEFSKTSSNSYLY